MASLLGAFGVMIGAFGAHGLQDLLLKNGTLAAFQTGVHYHFYHTLAMLMIGILTKFFPHKLLRISSACMFLGVIFFSGSLYLLGITNVKILGAITPIGGVGFIAGWITLALGIYKTPSSCKVK